MMEWQKQQQHQHQHELEEDELKNGVVDGVGGLYAKVMTDEQLELLRQQISLYSSICHQLVNMHKSISAQQDLAGMRLGNLYCDPIFVSGAAHKITPRQRWTPSPMQLQILEQIFDQGNGTPTKHKIKDITLQLTQYGPISESNVYNWFQNRRARSKRKQPNSATNNNNNPDSEADTEVDSPKDKKTTPDTFQTCQPKSNSFYPQIHDLGAEMLSFDAQSNEEEPMFQSYRSGINDEMSVPDGYTSYHHPL